MYTTESVYTGYLCVWRAYYACFSRILLKLNFGIIISYKIVKAMCYSHDSHILMYQNYSGKEVTYDENNPDRRRPGILGGSE